ncbi:hypothetical protein [Alkalicoccobacillus plakortidis]|uniref:Uncharacterized protein n=1 Tax=Alkalicoccobacillus plakortidis TaxID=444060 RepID=A0ABT0XQ59_9BACI|nr:hypothetical protein [Alkalicoccobacillus plakortidis]MCM2678046.1 hypothetical protein [Alkalicoccobacillus plakortidis]
MLQLLPLYLFWIGSFVSFVLFVTTVTKRHQYKLTYNKHIKSQKKYRLEMLVAIKKLQQTQKELSIELTRLKRK